MNGLLRITLRNPWWMNILKELGRKDSERGSWQILGCFSITIFVIFSRPS
jgi:hypothetical protein